MVELAGETLLAHQRRSLAAVGIEDVHIVLGHGAQLVKRHVDAQDLTVWTNPDYASTNMVATLVCARDALNGATDLLIAYGDIVYEPRVIAALDEVDAEVVVSVDLAWRDYWAARMEDPLADAETLRMTSDGRLREIGLRPVSYEDVEAQYIGLIRVRMDVVTQFAESAKRLVREDPSAFMTTLLQRLVDEDWDVRVAPTTNGWLEIDRSEDLDIDFAAFWSPVPSS
jgi:choline kinase